MHSKLIVPEQLCFEDKQQSYMSRISLHTACKGKKFSCAAPAGQLMYTLLCIQAQSAEKCAAQLKLARAAAADAKAASTAAAAAAADASKAVKEAQPSGDTAACAAAQAAASAAADKAAQSGDCHLALWSPMSQCAAALNLMCHQLPGAFST